MLCRSLRFLLMFLLSTHSIYDETMNWSNCMCMKMYYALCALMPSSGTKRCGVFCFVCRSHAAYAWLRMICETVLQRKIDFDSVATRQLRQQNRSYRRQSRTNSRFCRQCVHGLILNRVSTNQCSLRISSRLLEDIFKKKRQKRVQIQRRWMTTEQTCIHFIISCFKQHSTD